jgi:hypothetical protein
MSSKLQWIEPNTLKRRMVNWKQNCVSQVHNLKQSIKTIEHLQVSTEYLGVVLPCPHHPRASGGSIIANLIVYSESEGSKLHFPADG